MEIALIVQRMIKTYVGNVLGNALRMTTPGIILLRVIDSLRTNRVGQSPLLQAGSWSA